jgi:uncharacterized protein (DUF1684 family)
MQPSGNFFPKKFNTGLRIRPVFILLSLLAILMAACNQYTPEQEAIAAGIKQQRLEKDQWLKSEKNSPLLEEDKADFKGLKYYPVDLSLRFEGSITKYDSVIPDTIIGTKGELRPALKYGYFPFTYRGNGYKLEVYKMLRDDPEYAKYLFLGFTDSTSGQETYGGGRYIDMTENEENFYLLDFNLAYNPYCAYNPRYSCAIPPAANRLSFKVTAGEKIFKEH